MNKLDVIVSLTTYKGRIYNRKFLHCLYFLLTQNTTFNYKVVLVLSEEEFTNKEKDLPEDLTFLNENCENFEILWTYKNTKALKKYNPTNKAYPDIPIICLGDDTIYSRDLVQRVYSDYLVKNKHDKVCLCACSNKAGQVTVPWRIRIFPPNCMLYIDEKYFAKFFHENDDLFYGVRLWLAHTNVETMKSWHNLWVGSHFGQEQTLNQIYSKYDQSVIVKEFFKACPQLLIDYAST